jgi:cytochrome oxidase Cu insertion factor (SCO1/SenC/PrrC family)
MYNQPRKGIPDFDLIQIDGSHLKASNLLKGQPLMIVYFDPDCDHCVMFITELLQKMDAFKNVQIVMVTYVPVRTVRNFVNNMGISKFTGIKIGTEGSNFIVRYHYDVVQFPYLALHDKNGNLFATFESEVPAPEELAVLFSNK